MRSEKIDLGVSDWGRTIVQRGILILKARSVRHCKYNKSCVLYESHIRCEEAPQYCMVLARIVYLPKSNSSFEMLVMIYGDI